MAVTSRDVAARAGVSQSTVSLVFSGKAVGRVGKPTIEAVQRAARELGYRPNAAARTLRTGRARSLALVVPDVTNPFFGLLLRGAQRAASAHGYTVVLVDVARDAEARATSVHALQSAAVDGYLSFELDPHDIDPGWREPTVAIEAWEGRTPKVRLDVEGGMRLVADHLRGLGHARIGHLASLYPAATFTARAAALAEALGGAPPAERAEHATEPARVAALRLLERDVTAIVCDDDVLAGGVYLAARERGVRIPQDLSVVGFDDLDLARVLDLTTVAVHAEALGATAVARLLALLAGEDGPETTIAPTELVVRGSTAPPEAG